MVIILPSFHKWKDRTFQKVADFCRFGRLWKVRKGFVSPPLLACVRRRACVKHGSYISFLTFQKLPAFNEINDLIVEGLALSRKLCGNCGRMGQI